MRPISPLDGYRPKFRPDQPCELQEVPDLHAEDGDAAEEQISPQNVRNDPATLARVAKAQLEWTKLTDHMRRTALGQPTFDPLVYKGPLEQEVMEALDLIRLDSGKLADAPKAAEVTE